MSPKVGNAIRTHLCAGKGILKVAALVGVGSGLVKARQERDGGRVAGGGVKESRPQRHLHVVR